MATTTTTVIPILIRTPYQFPYGSTENTPVPSAEINFSAYEVAITAAAAGESQKLTIGVNLPGQYAYQLTYLSAFMTDNEAGDMADWGADFRAFLSNTNSGSSTGAWLAGLCLDGCGLWAHSATRKGRTWKLDKVPDKMVIPITGTTGRLQLDNWNLSIDGGPMTLSFSAKFLQYDLAQAYNWAANTPIPIRG